MPERASKKQPRGRLDFAQNAFRMVQEATGQAPKTDLDSVPPVVIEKNAAAVALGKLGGAKGGKARAEALSPKKRSAIAKKAAKARWG